MASDSGRQFGLASTSLDHREHVKSMNAAITQQPVAVECSEEGTMPVGFDQRSVEVRIDVSFCLVVSRDVVELASLFVEAKPHSPALRKVVFNVHGDDRSDASKAVDHDCDQCPVAKPCCRRNVDTLQKLASFVCG